MHARSYPEQRGSLVPFSLRLLHAQLPSHTGRQQVRPAPCAPGKAVTLHLSYPSTHLCGGPSPPPPTRNCMHACLHTCMHSVW